MTPELVNDGDRRSIVVGAFRLVFEWTGDRWIHRLEHQGAGKSPTRVLAETLEGDPGRDDPARVVSPSYQDLHFQEAGNFLQALMVGQSGPHHFSAVFEVEARVFPPSADWPFPEPAHDVFIRVDVADRCRAPVEALAGTYRVNALSGDLLQASRTCIDWVMQTDRLTLAANHGGPTQLAWAEAGRRATMAQALATINPGAATHRFQYVWNWAPHDQDPRESGS